MTDLATVTDETFAEALQDHSALMLRFEATWCTASRASRDAFMEYAQSHGLPLHIATVDVDANPLIPTHLDIQVIPAHVLFLQGQPVSRIDGSIPVDMLHTHLRMTLGAGG